MPGDPGGVAPGSGPQPPAYLTMTMPGETAPEFSLTASFTQAGRPGLAAYMAVASDPAHAGYGDIRILGLPQDAVAAGRSRSRTPSSRTPPPPPS